MRKKNTREGLTRGICPNDMTYAGYNAYEKEQIYDEAI